MSEVINRESYIIRLGQWGDGGDWFGDVFATAGPYAEVALVSSGEFPTRYEVLVDLAERLFGKEVWHGN